VDVFFWDTVYYYYNYNELLLLLTGYVDIRHTTRVQLVRVAEGSTCYQYHRLMTDRVVSCH